MSEELIVDLSNYKDRSGARVREGDYLVVVEDAEMSKSQAGNQMVNLWLRIVGGEFDGQTIVDRLTLTEKSLFRVVGFLQAINIPTPKKAIRLNLQNFIGKALQVTVADGEPFGGRIKTEVRQYMRSTGTVETASSAQEDEFDAMAKATSPDTSAAIDDLPEVAPAPAETAVAEDAPEHVDLATVDL